MCNNKLLTFMFCLLGHSFDVDNGPKSAEYIQVCCLLYPLSSIS